MDGWMGWITAGIAARIAAGIAAGLLYRTEFHNNKLFLHIHYIHCSPHKMT